jgi:hypothetical protein
MTRGDVVARDSGGGTGGPVVAQSAQAARAVPPVGETVVYRGDVASTPVDSGIPGALGRAWDPAGHRDAVRSGTGCLRRLRSDPGVWTVV